MMPIRRSERSEELFPDLCMTSSQRKDILTKGRIVIIPFLHGKLTADGKPIELTRPTFHESMPSGLLAMVFISMEREMKLWLCK